MENVVEVALKKMKKNFKAYTHVTVYSDPQHPFVVKRCTEKERQYTGYMVYGNCSQDRPTEKGGGKKEGRR